MRLLPVIILAGGMVVAALLIYKAVSKGSAQAAASTAEASRFREGLAASPLGKYLLDSSAWAGTKANIP